MTWIRKFSGDRSAPIVAVYTCPRCGEFVAEVVRDEKGEAPDVITCCLEVKITNGDITFTGGCTKQATWTPSPVGCRVRRVEAVKGKWDKPERPTYLNTRNLGEGQDMEEFQAERKKIWRRKREADVMAVKRGH